MTGFFDFDNFNNQEPRGYWIHFVKLKHRIGFEYLFRFH